MRKILAVVAVLFACSPTTAPVAPEGLSFTHLVVDPNAPSNFTAVTTGNVQGQATEVLFSWQDNTTNETAFQVFGFNPGNGKGKTTTAPANATSVTSLWAPGTWTFRVRSAIGTNVDGDTVYTDWSDPVVLTLCGSKCG